MRIPRKAELLRLQAIYKTDARIAEALGGIQEYLVAYWRRKKGIGRHSSVKFSQQQIGELWERYGDDFRCGRELNISRAAFYSWRRKYDLLEKPVALKLEQLELHLGRAEAATAPARAPSPRTASAKIAERCRESWPHVEHAADWQIALRGEGPAAPVAVCPGPVLEWPRDEPSADVGDMAPYGWRDPVWCLPERGSITWQLVEGHSLLPGQLIRGPQELLGGLGGVGSLVLGSECGPVPSRIVKIELTRRLPPHTDVEDIFLALLSHGWDTDWAGAVVEFWGAPIERLSVDRKVRLCALTTVHGAAAALCPFDDVTRRHYGRLLRGRFPRTHPDRAAEYQGEHFLEGRNIGAQMGARDGSGALHVIPPDNADAGGVLIGPDAFPFEIEAAAEFLKDRAIRSEGRRGTLLVCPATAGVYRLAQRRGWVQTIVNAGGSVLDVTLRRRLGIPGLAELAGSGDDSRAIIVTGAVFKSEGELSRPVLFASTRTAIHQGLEFL